jgi:hypothetical protein
MRNRKGPHLAIAPADLSLLLTGLVMVSCFIQIHLVLLRHEFLRRDGPAIGALQQGHRDRVLTRAPISRRRMVAIEFGM